MRTNLDVHFLRFDANRRHISPSHEPFLRTVAFRPLPRSTAESARKQPKGCGPPGFRFKGHVHGPEAKKTSHEPGRASLSPASRVGRVPSTSSGSPERTRPAGVVGQNRTVLQTLAARSRGRLARVCRLRHSKKILLGPHRRSDR
ncbi:MAG: hypothetical protein FJ398_00755 [Verrucomicrobia bacterium]|nr:hypothetical protein [Verrucomicrobiota bacterium]